MWTEVATGVASFQLEGDRVGALHRDATVRVKDGIHGVWTTLAADALAFQVQENAIGVLAMDGLRVREGISGAWKALRTTFAGASQFQLLVDVPLVFRIRPPAYDVQAARCDAQFAEGEDADGKRRCYPTYATRTIGQVLIVGTYARFCGAGVPSDGNWDWAHAEGVVNPVDGACREHDHAGWYGINPNQFRYHACVVRYAMQHSRLTVDGMAVAEDTPEWDAAWAFMPRTKDARKGWLQESSGIEACTANLLEDFTEATRSKR